MSILAGASYRMRDAVGREQNYHILSHDDQTGVTTVLDLSKSSRPIQRIALSQHRIIKEIRACAVQTKDAIDADSISTTQLYIVKTGSGTYKIGCTDNLDARMRAGRTWCSTMSKVAARTIPKFKTRQWRRYEKKLHSRFASQRCSSGGSEVFKFNNVQVQQAIGYLKHMRFN